MQDLILDPSIRDYVLIPMVVAVFIFGMLRFYLTKLMASPAEGQEAQKLLKPIELQDFEEFPKAEAIFAECEKEHVYSQALVRSTRIRVNCGYLPEDSVAVRKSFYWKKEGGFFHQQVETNPMSAMMNPAMMTGMLKQSFMSQIYQVGLSFGLGYFFSGFIMAKLPFGLTQKFKVMLHQGFDIPLLDASFVSSMSLAFLFIYGLQGVYGLMFDSNPVGEDLKMMNPQYMMGGAGAPNQPKDYTKLFESERDNYNLMNYDFELDKAEDYLINKFKAGRLFE